MDILKLEARIRLTGHGERDLKKERPEPEKMIRPTPNSIPGAVAASGGAIALAFGLLALIGWATDAPFLASLGDGKIPMAPSAALLFAISGSAILIRAAGSPSSRVLGAARTGILATSALALILLCSSLLGLHSGVESLGLRFSRGFPGMTLGRISPVTSFCFLVAASSYLLAEPRSAPSLRRVASALIAAYLLLSVCLVFLLGYFFEKPLLYGSGQVPPALSTILAFTAIGVALAVSGSERYEDAAGAAEPATSARGSYLIPSFVLFTVGVVTAGYLNYLEYAAGVRAGIEGQLTAVSKLKVEELVQYRKERLSDADMLSERLTLSGAAQRFFRNPRDLEAEALLESGLDKYADQYQYDRATLVDAEGAIYISKPDGAGPLPVPVARAVAASMDSGRTVFQDFYRDETDGKVYLGLVIPLPGDGRKDRPAGAVILRIDPTTYIYPFIQEWPVPSETAETLLVRRDGDSVLFLNELRFRGGTALRLRDPMVDRDLPAVRAVLGEEGIIRAKDYRGVEVVASLRPVPDSPWFVVAKIDASEAFAALGERLWMLIILIGALALGEAAAIAISWRSQKLRYYREKYESAEALRETTDFLENLIKYANAPIIVWDPDFRITRFNHAFESLTGLDASRVLGGPPDMLFPPDQAESSLRLIKSTGMGERWDAVEIDIRNVDGSVHTVLWNSATVLSADGKRLVATIAQGQDISGMKTAEDETRRAKEDLELRVAERTAQLEDANREMEAFTYSVSHDLRAPLRAIDGFSSFLLEDYSASLDSEGRRLLGVIRKNSQRMGQLITDLLSLSKVSRTEIRSSRVDMTALVASALSEAAPPDAGAFEMDLRSLPDAWGDPSLLRQVWVNLISNAFKYSMKSPVKRIEIGGYTDGGDLVYYVRDEGAGFEPEYADKLFTPFQRLHKTEEFAGNGIGLALVQRIVARHDGKVRAEGRPGKGATFYFSLPDKEDEA
jgi:PAS domain S-box-containing protein